MPRGVRLAGFGVSDNGGDILIRLSFLHIAWTNSANLFNEMIVALDSGKRRVR